MNDVNFMKWIQEMIKKGYWNPITHSTTLKFTKEVTIPICIKYNICDKDKFSKMNYIEIGKYYFHRLIEKMPNNRTR